MKRLFGLIGAALVFAPAAAGADYLTSAFRDSCEPEEGKHYSGADPVIATVPMAKSEIDRVSNNFLVFTGFTVDKTYGDSLRGHVYGIRLFSEKTEYGNDWEFTATNDPDLLLKCGDPNAACLFDAGEMLAERKARGVARKILVGVPDMAKIAAMSLPDANGAVTIPMVEAREVPAIDASSVLDEIWNAYRDIAPIRAAMPSWNAGTARWNCSQLPTSVPKTLCDPTRDASDRNLLQPGDLRLDRLGMFLHGTHRVWPLADVYHSSATVVEPPAYEYLDRYYPEFREALKDRPSMIYVGANDGMIHAFYGSPDIHCDPEKEACPRWQPGEEAWAYLPMNMLARAMVANERYFRGIDTTATRFFSMDLSCRYTDVQIDRQYKEEGDCDGSSDPYCGWRTVLLCGEGWGGSWYVALDVTEPTQPKPLWEFTHANLGRTWSLPSLSIVPMEDPGTGTVEPVWIATFGSGYNNRMVDANNNTLQSYRYLNLQFDGAYPQHGRGAGKDIGRVFLLDAASGTVVKTFSAGSQGTPFVADGTVLDFNYDGFVDAGYMGQFKGIHRVRFGRTAADMEMCPLITLGSKQVLTAHPTAFAYSVDEDATEFPVVLVSGAGLDSGKDPDQQANQGNIWSVRSDLFQERVGGTCSIGGYYCDLAPGFNGFNDGSRKARLLGAPLFARQANKDDWILYTVWTAPHFNKVDKCPSEDEKTTGTAHLFCMDVTLVPKEGGAEGETEPRCEPCEGYEEPGADANIIYENESNPPNAPVSADGRVYLTDPNSGISTRGINTADGGAPKPNSTPPTAAVPAHMLSWREVY